MTTDNQIIENPDALKDLDVYCQVTEQTALESIVNAWHNFEAGKEFLAYCKNKLPIDKRDTALKVSRYSLSDLPEVEHFETLEFTQVALNLNKDEFDILVMSLSNGLADWQAHERRAKNDPESLQAAKNSDLANLRNARDSNLKALRDSRDSDLSSLQKSQSSELNSARQRLEFCSNDIERKKVELEELNKSLLIEILFLAASFILGGSIGGAWGAIIALAVVFFWRLQS
ncbi:MULTISPECIES: hypothetical protein [Pseudanabaena]|uniref:Uncharacterized protein n=2 Tax=Pseudanabaena TaxID=1152 RepID=L8N0V2_9CYAN|nr:MULTISPECIES: hypothetical protein [Pseudanabaena]ELS33822.1 hypothetical protein Pse7429DRAFT_1170 [Pseudanabaena biceps PCC 7429]MDG3493982.1 hypothetical protein [Pseudanabaena catenata USMAC16]